MTFVVAYNINTSLLLYASKRKCPSYRTWVQGFCKWEGTVEVGGGWVRRGREQLGGGGSVGDLFGGTEHNQQANNSSELKGVGITS